MIYLKLIPVQSMCQGDFNENYRQLGDRKANDAGEQLAELM